jgi:hypothetical protein
VHKSGEYGETGRVSTPYFAAAHRRITPEKSNDEPLPSQNQ